MLSQQDVYRRLTDNFVCLRLDWEQGNHFKDRFGFILGTGDQMILSPKGDILRPADLGFDEHQGVLFGRHGCDTTGDVLNRVIELHEPHDAKADWSMDWFMWSTKPSRRRGGFYPASPQSIATFARLPIAVVRGPLPEALKNSEFLRWHVRQFIWTHEPDQSPNGEHSRIFIRRVREGLPEDLPTQLADLQPDSMDLKELGEALDAAWLTYMKDRPRVAGGYLENPHGRWMRGVGDTMIYEDEEVRRQAEAGILQAPGRAPGAKPPYLVRDP